MPNTPQSTLETNDQDHRILIVYNADSGFFNAVFSSIHKTLSPHSYNCPLCRITYGVTGMLRAWQTYLENLSIPFEFLHKNQFREAYPAAAGDTTLPAIFIRDRKNRLSVIMDADEITSADNILTLIMIMDEKLSARGLHAPRQSDKNQGGWIGAFPN